MNNYSPQMIEKMDSNRLPLATASILGQAPWVSLYNRYTMIAFTIIIQSRTLELF